jgi:hypothetical protein
MRSCTLLLALAAASAQAVPAPPEPVELSQGVVRLHPDLTLPKDHAVGPTIPGLAQGAIPQGLAYWKKQNWFLISHYFEDKADPSVVTAVDARTGSLVRCLTLVEAGNKAHKGHVGGLAVSDKYLWVGSGPVLYRVPLAAIVAARPLDHLQLQPLFEPECTASNVAYHDKRVWVGEFVLRERGRMGDPAHEQTDRKSTKKYAWVAGYALDGNENVIGAAGGKAPPPAAVLSVRQKVQGMAFLGDHIFLSMSFDRKDDSTLAVYKNPLPGELSSPHRMVKPKAGGKEVPLWFLDGLNRVGDDLDLPPMCEGITAYGDSLALVFESGAEKYQEGGRGPIDTVVFLKPPGGK